MASWAGFSEEELRKMQQKEADQPVTASLGRGRRSATTNRSRQQLQREKALQVATQQKDHLTSAQQLQPILPTSAALDKVPEQACKDVEAETVQAERGSVSADQPAAVKELDTEEVELQEKNRLQHLQWEQKLMEEKNKRTKALLAKTIAEKSKQTQAEAVKLKKIQGALQALDHSVSTDIGILRKLIEQASMEYSSAWKRMEKAEAEYVAAKLDLHRKTETKERLTEHLSAIIQQNEMRKARKLEELMLQLELHTGEALQSALEEQHEGEGSGPPTTDNPLQNQNNTTDNYNENNTIGPKKNNDQNNEPITCKLEGTS